MTRRLKIDGKARSPARAGQARVATLLRPGDVVAGSGGDFFALGFVGDE